MKKKIEEIIYVSFIGVLSLSTIFFTVIGLADIADTVFKTLVTIYICRNVTRTD